MDDSSGGHQSVNFNIHGDMDTTINASMPPNGNMSMDQLNYGHQSFMMDSTGMNQQVMPPINNTLHFYDSSGPGPVSSASNFSIPDQPILPMNNVLYENNYRMSNGVQFSNSSYSSCLISSSSSGNACTADTRNPPYQSRELLCEGFASSTSNPKGEVQYQDKFQFPSEGIPSFIPDIDPFCGMSESYTQSNILPEDLATVESSTFDTSLRNSGDHLSMRSSNPSHEDRMSEVSTTCATEDIRLALSQSHHGAETDTGRAHDKSCEEGFGSSVDNEGSKSSIAPNRSGVDNVEECEATLETVVADTFSRNKQDESNSKDLISNITAEDCDGASIKASGVKEAHVTNKQTSEESSRREVPSDELNSFKQACPEQRSENMNTENIESVSDTGKEKAKSECDKRSDSNEVDAVVKKESNDSFDGEDNRPPSPMVAAMNFNLIENQSSLLSSTASESQSETAASTSETEHKRITRAKSGALPPRPNRLIVGIAEQNTDSDSCSIPDSIPDEDWNYPEGAESALSVVDPSITAPDSVLKVVPEEMEFYETMFGSGLEAVLKMRLHCTICGVHIGAAPNYLHLGNQHKVLRVLICNRCRAFYGQGKFPHDSDGSEIYCRWCGQGGQIICCSHCPNVFCKSCLRRNFGSSQVKDIEDSSDWSCLVCNYRELWQLRGICWALLKYTMMKKREALSSSNVKKFMELEEDKSKCCGFKNHRKKKSSTKNKTSASKTASAMHPSAQAAPTPVVPEDFLAGHFLFPNLGMEDEPSSRYPEAEGDIDPSQFVQPVLKEEEQDDEVPSIVKDISMSAGNSMVRRIAPVLTSLPVTFSHSAPPLVRQRTRMIPTRGPAPRVLMNPASTPKQQLLIRQGGVVRPGLVRPGPALVRPGLVRLSSPSALGPRPQVQITPARHRLALQQMSLMRPRASLTKTPFQPRSSLQMAAMQPRTPMQLSPAQPRAPSPMLLVNECLGAGILPGLTTSVRPQSIDGVRSFDQLRSLAKVEWFRDGLDAMRAISQVINKRLRDLEARFHSLKSKDDFEKVMVLGKKLSRLGKRTQRRFNQIDYQLKQGCKTWVLETGRRQGKVTSFPPNYDPLLLPLVEPSSDWEDDAELAKPLEKVLIPVNTAAFQGMNNSDIVRPRVVSSFSLVQPPSLVPRETVRPPRPPNPFFARIPRPGNRPIPLQSSTSNFRPQTLSSSLASGSPPERGPPGNLIQFLKNANIVDSGGNSVSITITGQKRKREDSDSDVELCHPTIPELLRIHNVKPCSVSLERCDHLVAFSMQQRAAEARRQSVHLEVTHNVDSDDDIQFLEEISSSDLPQTSKPAAIPEKTTPHEGVYPSSPSPSGGRTEACANATDLPAGEQTESHACDVSEERTGAPETMRPDEDKGVGEVSSEAPKGDDILEEQIQARFDTPELGDTVASPGELNNAQVDCNKEEGDKVDSPEATKADDSLEEQMDVREETPGMEDPVVPPAELSDVHADSLESVDVAGLSGESTKASEDTAEVTESSTPPEDLTEAPLNCSGSVDACELQEKQDEDFEDTLQEMDFSSLPGGENETCTDANECPDASNLSE